MVWDPEQRGRETDVQLAQASPCSVDAVVNSEVPGPLECCRSELKEFSDSTSP